MEADNWILINDRLPNSGERCLVTDGDVIFIATYILEPDGNNLWVFSGMTEDNSKNFKVQSWMELPKPPEKKIIVVETNQTNEKRNDN